MTIRSHGGRGFSLRSPWLFPFCAPVSSNVVKLNRFRKKKQRDDKAKQAEINCIRHGRTQAEKDRELAERQRAARLLEGKRLESGAAPGDEAEPVES